MSYRMEYNMLKMLGDAWAEDQRALYTLLNKNREGDVVVLDSEGMIELNRLKAASELSSKAFADYVKLFS